MENSFGDRLKLLRLRLGLSQREIAKKIGISNVAYYKYETGKSQPRLDVIIKLHTIFNVNIYWLLYGTGHIFRVVDFNEKILNSEDMLDLFDHLNHDPNFRYALLSYFEDYKVKFPEKFEYKKEKGGNT